jgi:hypothetical protein
LVLIGAGISLQIFSNITLGRKNARMNVQYKTVEPVLPQAADISADAEPVSGVIKRFAKAERVDVKALAFDWIKTTYPEAIEYTGIDRSVRGVALTVAIASGAMFLPAAFWAGNEAYFGRASDHWFLFTVGGIVMAPSFTLVTIWMLLWAIRLELFSPTDVPTIFDRHHRKVYRILREVPAGWGKLFKRWPVKFVEYDWDLINAEHQVVVSATTNTVSRYHSLIMVVRKSATDPTVVDYFNVGNAITLGELTVAPVWEHIRRFMEEGGPHLPPGEKLADPLPPQTWWQSMGAVGCFGSNYFAWWREHPILTTFFHLLLPFFLPLNLIWGTSNWLSYRTAFSVEWPSEILQRVGAGMQATAARFNDD